MIKFNLKVNKMKREDRCNGKRAGALSYIRRTVAVGILATIVVLCVVFREHITVENIVEFVPKNSVASVLVMLVLFALKSLSMFFYSGLLYAASGFLFSLPLAILVNIAGTAIMASIPYFVGRRAGKKLLERLLRKNRRLELLRDMQNRNQFLSCLLIRFIGIFPLDVAGAYFGASGMRYRSYFCGTVIGLLPSAVCFAVMGMSIDDIGSPEFIISASIEIGLIALSAVMCLIWGKKQENRRKRGE